MITKAQFNLFDRLFDYYNKELFNGKLNDCMINMSRLKGASGFFIPKRWNGAIEKKLDIHEISLNPEYLDRMDVDWQSTLVHEMVHLWQHDYGKTSRNGYHNRQWALKMEEIGLIPSSTGQPGGKKTGQRMTHYIAVDGLFINAFNRLIKKQLKYTPLPISKESKSAHGTMSKIKYECPCGNKVWGKPELHIICAVCNKSFEQTN
jgi:predicted SprT family Zn-dependent metalloprotease